MKNVKEVPANRQLAKNNFGTILFFILLVAFSLLLGLLPALSFGQDGFPSPTIPASPSDVPPSFSPSSTPAAITLPTAADSTSNVPSNDYFSTPTVSNNSESVLPNPNTNTNTNSSSSSLPFAAPARPLNTPRPNNVPLSDSYGPATPTRLLPNRSEPLRSVAEPNHPFARYFALPKEPQSIIKGQPYTIAELLDGTKTSGSRRQLLQTYWELTGLLAEYNIRCEAEHLSGSVQDAQQNLITVLLQQQRRSVEMEFVKKQWQLTGLLRRFKRISVSEKELPIPCDYPLFKRYETLADKIARTARSQYLGHLIPVQEQLIDARRRSCTIIFEMLQSIPSDSRQLIEVLNRRTTAFLELVEAVIDYNKMIAEYTSETIPPEVSGFRLVGALIELPKTNPPISNQSTEYAAPEIWRLSGTPQRNPQTDILRSNLVPQRLPAGNVPVPPIEPAIIQAAYDEEQ
ncbi:MAG: hypothetical protein LBF88_03410 [Planctomycetaceae bacterium]|jgi:hypothetical protein|nr:hypothetical protein [Planctomycetaceae bacterium]